MNVVVVSERIVSMCLISLLCIGATLAAEKPSDVVAFGINNYGNGYSYTAFLNGEPIRYGSGPGLTVLRGYPLREGSNIFHAEISTTKTVVARVRMDASIRIGSEWLALDEFRENGPLDAPVEWEFEFEVTNRLGGIQVSFDDLTKDANMHIRESRILAVELAKTIASRDVSMIEEAFSSTNALQIQSSYPKWFFDLSEKEIGITRVTNTTDVTTVVGKKLILCRASSKAAFGLVWAKQEKRNLATGHDFFIFGRVSGRWGIVGPEYGWTALRLPFATTITNAIPR